MYTEQATIFIFPYMIQADKKLQAWCICCLWMPRKWLWNSLPIQTCYFYFRCIKYCYLDFNTLQTIILKIVMHLSFVTGYYSFLHLKMTCSRSDQIEHQITSMIVYREKQADVGNTQGFCCTWGKETCLSFQWFSSIN